MTSLGGTTICMSVTLSERTIIYDLIRKIYNTNTSYYSHHFKDVCMHYSFFLFFDY